MNMQPAVLAAAILTAGLTMAPAAQAVTQTRAVLQQGGPACQLSVPTTATTVRPRATGIRNEGTTSAFVICQMESSTGALNGAVMYVTSIDGTPRNVTCTAVNGYNLAPSVMKIAFSPKTLATDSSSGLAAVFQWSAPDFGGAAAGDNFPNDGWFSVTCLLPPQTAINLLATQYVEDVGA